MYRCAVVIVALAGCGKQISPVEPWVYAASIDPSARHEPDYRDHLRGPALVGLEFAIVGEFSARCEKSDEPLLAKKDSWEYGTHQESCKSEDTTVVVQCAGPCIAHGSRVTATAPGLLRLSLDMTSRQHHTVKTLEIEAVAPERIVVNGCAGDEENPCVLQSGQLSAAVVGGDDQFSAPITMSFAGQDITFVSTIKLAERLGRLAPGNYLIELRYGGLVKPMTLVIP